MTQQFHLSGTAERPAWEEDALIDPWPRPERSRRVGIAVVGGGITGLAAALELAEAGARVVVLEAGRGAGAGASGRAGGFACLGSSRLSPGEMARRHGPPFARAFRALERAGVEAVQALLARLAPEALQGPEGEACLAHSPAAFRAMCRVAQDEARLLGEAPALIPRAELAAHGLPAERFHGAAVGRHGFPVQPLRYTCALGRAAHRAGAELLGGAAVAAIRRRGDEWLLQTAAGPAITARRVILGAGRGACALFPRSLGGSAVGVPSSVLTTRPLDRTEQVRAGLTSRLMAYDSRRFLHYFRQLPDGRFLFGMRGALGAEGTTPGHRRRMLRHLARLFPALAGVPATAFWSGEVVMTASGLPFLGPVPGAPGVWAAFGYHGNGIAMGTLAGQRLARMALGLDPGLPPQLCTPPRRFRQPWLTGLALRAAFAADGLAELASLRA